MPNKINLLQKIGLSVVIILLFVFYVYDFITVRYAYKAIITFTTVLIFSLPVFIFAFILFQKQD